MSEYQYYKFQAIDQPLTAKEMAELRPYFTRAASRQHARFSVPEGLQANALSDSLLSL